jgi:hypothetical protein
MTNKNRLTSFALSFLILISFELSAETKSKSEKIDSNKNAVIAQTKANKQKTEKFSYVPPKRGAPAVRIGGGTRGIGEKTLELEVFAPDHTGLTTKTQPKLYWYVSEPVVSKLEVTLINDEQNEPVFEKIIETSGAAGIQSVDLAKMGIKLKSGLEYRWFVSVIPDKNQRSNDIVASGVIKHIVPDAELKSKLSAANQLAMIDIYARNSIWFDAIDTLMQMVSKYPKNSDLQNKRTALLKQVGLHSAADYMQKKN